MAYTAGAAQIHVTPDFTGFHRSIAAKLDAENDTFTKAGAKWGKAASAGFESRFDPKVKVKPDVDDAKAKTELDGLGKTRTPKIAPKVDDEAAKLTFRELVKTRTATIKVRVDAAGAALKGAGIGEALAGLKVPALGAAAIGLAPTALGGGLLAAGAGLSAATAAAGIGAFAAVAVPEIQKVTKAQTALTAAQAAYDKATTKAGRAAALKAEAAATAGLTGEEKKLAVQLGDLRSAWQKVQQSQEPVVGRALTPWLATATEGMKYLHDVVTPAASAIGALGEEAKTAFQAPFWHTFFDTLGQAGETAITGFGDALGHVGDGFAHLFVTFAPDIEKLPGLVNGWARSFDDWAQHYNKSGLDNFLKKTFSPQNIGSLKGDLKDLGKTFGNLATATENMSPLAFTGLSNVLSLLAKLSPGQIEAIALIYGGIKAGQAAGSLGQGITGVLGALGGKGGAAKDAEGVAGKSRAAKLGSGLGSLLLIPAAIGTLASTPSGTVRPGGGKAPYQGNWWENPGGMPGPHDKASAGNWLTSWSPYENFFTKTLPGWARTGWKAANTPIPGTNNQWLTSWTPYENFFTKTIPGWGRAAAHGLGNAWNASSGWVSSQFGKASSWVTGKFKGAGNWLKSTGTSIAHGIGNGWNSARNWVSSTAGAAKGWITGKFKSAGSWLTSHGSSAAHGLASGYDSAKGWVGSVAGRAKGWITGKFSAAGSWLRSHGSDAAHGLASGYASASGWVGSVAGRAKSWVTGRFSAAGSWLRGAGSNAAHGLASGYASASGWVSSVAGRAWGWVTGAFRGAGGWLYGIGQSIIGGLASGLRSAVGGVESILNWITSKIPSWKGPAAVDRALLRPAARDIMAGFTGEIAAGIPGVRSVMGQVTQASALNVPRISGASLPRVRGGDGGSLALTIGASGNDQLLQAIVRSLRADISAKAGGDVQQHLGKGKART